VRELDAPRHRARLRNALGDYRLRLTFADGMVGDVDLPGEEWRGVFAPLADPDFFARVSVDPESGTIA